MLHLRLIVPLDLAEVVIDHLRSVPGVTHLVHLPGSATSPPGDVVLCDVAREAANDVVEWLQDHAVHRRGAIAVVALDAVVSDAAQRAEALAPGQGADALVWEEVEERARDEATLTASFLVFISIAAMIAAVGILLDSPILLVGAMVVGPEYGPLAALCVSVVRRRPGPAGRALATLAIGLATATVAALVATLAFRVTGVAPESYSADDHQLTSFVAHPDALAAVVAVLAGIVGMLALTQGRSGALIGVFVSVTTIPAVGAVGVATAYRRWDEVGGAALQLGINVAGLVVAGVLTLAAQARMTLPARPGPPRRWAAPSPR